MSGSATSCTFAGFVMLSMSEEVVLLAVDETSGGLRSTREFGTAYALVGAVFYDLALARKIDTDTENVQLIDTKATGNATLDRVLARMAARPDLKTVRAWIEQIFQQRDDLEGEALASLIARASCGSRIPSASGSSTSNASRHRQQTAAGRQGSPGKRHRHRRDSRDARHHAREYRRTLRTPWLCAQRKCARPPPASHPDAVQSGNHQPHRDRRDPRPGVHPAPFHHQSRLRFAIRPSVGIGRKNHWSEKAERESDDPGPSHPWWGRLQPVNPSEARTLLVPTTDAANWGLT